MAASSKTLPDGRNAHILQQNRYWWEATLRSFFRLAQVFERGPLLHVLVVPQKGAKVSA